MRRAILLAALALPAAAREQALSAPFAILAKARSPYDLLAAAAPPRYTVPVTLEGSIAGEIRTSLAAVGAPDATLEEVHEGGGKLSLRVAGQALAGRTREMISGALNPAAMTEVLLRSVLRYHEPSSLAAMERETRATVTRSLAGDTVLLTVTLSPQGDRFARTWTDEGVCAVETWLSTLSVTVDSARSLVRTVSFVKHTRVAGPSGSDERAKPQSFEARYAATAGKILPTSLEFSSGGITTLSLSARYRSERAFTVLDRRTILCRLSDGRTADLTLRYGTYRQGAEALPRGDEGGSRKLSEAATYARKAAEAMNRGDLRAAAASYRLLADRYGSTPQGVEARKLIGGLPADF